MSCSKNVGLIMLSTVNTKRIEKHNMLFVVVYKLCEAALLQNPVTLRVDVVNYKHICVSWLKCRTHECCLGSFSC